MSHQQLLAPEHQSAQARAKAIYESLTNTFAPALKGKIIAIEAESEEYFLGETVLEAASKARAAHPEKTFHFFRIGFPTAYVWR